MKQQIKPGFFGINAAADLRRREFDIMNEQYLYCDKKADVVFFGDSITQHWELELYFNNSVLKINRGIGSDCTTFAAKRFEADVLQLQPKSVVILLGINDLLTTAPDLWWKCPGEDVDKVVCNIESNFRFMLSKCTDLKVYVCSVLPQNLCAPFDSNFFCEQILKVNDILKNLCSEYNATYVDYYSALECDGKLPEDMSVDGVHPNGKAYEIMANVLKKEVDIL